MNISSHKNLVKFFYSRLILLVVIFGLISLIVNTSSGPKTVYAADVCAKINFSVNDDPKPEMSTVALKDNDFYKLQLRIDDKDSSGASCNTPNYGGSWEFKVRYNRCYLKGDPNEGSMCSDDIEILSGEFVYQKTWPKIVHINAPKPVGDYRYNFTLAILKSPSSNPVYVSNSINFTGSQTSTTNSDTSQNPNDTKTTDTKTTDTQTPADTGPKGKDNKDINTDVTFKCDPSPCNFDTPLGSVFNPLEDGITVPGIIVRLINILLMISGTVAVGFIIFGGLMMVTSAGNESRVTKGKQTVIYAVAGLVVSILSFSIVAIIQSIIN